MERRGVKGTCQLLFARHDGETIILDLIALDALTMDGQLLHRGSPFVLGIRMRHRMWFTSSLVDALGQAALNDSIVDLEVTDLGGAPTAIMKVGDTELVLEIDLSVQG
jgi:hypothetical protein